LLCLLIEDLSAASGSAIRERIFGNVPGNGLQSWLDWPPPRARRELYGSGLEQLLAKWGCGLTRHSSRACPMFRAWFRPLKDGRKITNDLLHSGMPFSGLLAFDDITAYGAIRALSENKRHVPEDFSAVGFDAIPTAALSTPGLTIRQPMLKIGEYAAECVLEMLKSASIPKSDVNNPQPPHACGTGLSRLDNEKS
jgi:hypothetical protein